MNWFTEIDLYCERVGTAFWAEPMNAISNLSFVLAALWGWYSISKMDKPDRVNQLLCILVACIGVGSFLFHTYANLWSSFADVIPIWSFVALYLIVSAYRAAGRPKLNPIYIIVGIGILAFAVYWIGQTGSETQEDVFQAPDPLNGSGQYAPALIALWGFALMCVIKKRTVWPWFISAAVVFTLSLVARTLDRDICASFPIGTHFIWHVMNGFMIGLLLQAMIRLESTRSLNESRV